MSKLSLFIVFLLFTCSLALPLISDPIRVLLEGIQGTKQQEKEGIWLNSRKNGISGLFQHDEGIFRVKCTQPQTDTKLILTLFDGEYLDESRIEMNVEVIVPILSETAENSTQEFYPVQINYGFREAFFSSERNFSFSNGKLYVQDGEKVKFFIVGEEKEFTLELTVQSNYPGFFAFFLYILTQAAFPLAGLRFLRFINRNPRAARRYIILATLIYINAWLTFQLLGTFFAYAKLNIFLWCGLFIILLGALVVPSRIYQAFLRECENKTWYHMALAYGVFPMVGLYIMVSKEAVLIMQGMWLFPQIIFNCVFFQRAKWRNSYVLGGCAAHALNLLYLKVYPNNILRIKPDPEFVVKIMAMMVVQIFILYLQKKTSKIARPASTNDEIYVELKDFSKINTDACSICLQDFEQEGIAKKQIIRTECEHCFHKECITSWLLLKPFCPKCRGVIKTDKIIDDIDSVH